MGKRVVIVGGGVIGLATAHYCRQRGLDVTLVERNGERRDGCSYENAGMIVPSHFTPLAAPGMAALGLKWMWNPASPFYVKPRPSWDLVTWGLHFWRAATREHVRRAAPLLRDLAVASRRAFEELAALPGADFGLAKNGLLLLCRTRRALDEEIRTAELAGALAIPAEVLDSGQAAALDPRVRMDIAGAVYFPLDCHLDPHRLVNGLQERLAATGTQFLWDTEVSGWRVDGERRLRAVRTTNMGDIEGDEFVLCGGAWTPSLVRELGVRIPLQAGKGYSLTLASPRQLPGICAILSEARIAVTPMGSALRFAGTMELAGMSDNVNHRRVRAIVDAVPRYYPDFEPSDFDGVVPWRGLRPCSPDGLPYVGRPARFANLCIAAGHAMMGVCLAPVTGQIVAGLLCGERSRFDMAQLSPDRYGPS